MTLIRSFVLSIAAVGAMATGANAADLFSNNSYNPGPTPFYNDPMFSFDGFYAGILGGGVIESGNVGGTLGGVAGVNFAVSDMFYLGAEAQGSAWFAGGGLVGYDALGLAHLGVLVTDNVMVYAAGGGGLIDGNTVYALGGGVEIGFADAFSLRGEGLALGPWGGTPAAGKIHAGLIFHMN